jgi:hypothetical protein
LPTRNTGAYAGKPANQIVISTIDVVDVVNDGLAIGNKAGNHQSSTCSDVGGVHRCADQLLYSPNDGMVAVDTHVGSKFL